MMRGEDERSEGLFSYVRLESRIPADHPLRAIRELVDAALRELSQSFERLYSRDGRPSIPPERLLRALLLQAFYTVRSERQLMEQLDYNLLFRWFVGLSADDPVWDATVFCKNRDRLLDGDIAVKFFTGVLNLPQVRRLLSSEHFSVDGTLIEAWASMKSFAPKDGGTPPGTGRGESGGRNAERNFHGQKRKNDTHSSTTDPDARLFRKGAGKEAKLCHMGHLMMENRNGLIVDARLTEANGTAERTTALDMIADSAKPGSTVGADKNYDTAAFVAGCRKHGCTPHVSQNNSNRRSAIDARTTRHPGYRISTVKRKRIEEPFGWMKTVGGLRKTRHCGRSLVEWFFVLTAAAYNLVRIPKIMAAQSESAWSSEDEAKLHEIPPPRPWSAPIDSGLTPPTIKKNSLQTNFFSSLLVLQSR
jgi:transposase